MSPRVSVVIPTYNRGNVLPRAIESTLAQTFSDFELIVVDDGSTDHTTEVVRGIADPRVRLVGDTTNRGPSAARNQGIREARCGLVAFLDSDDEWLPRKLELQLARMDGDPDPKTAVAYCRVYTYDDLAQRPVHEFGEPREGALFHDLLAGWHPVTTSLFLVRRAALLEVGGFDETLFCGEDYDLWLRLAQASYRFVGVNEVLVVKHENTGVQLSKDPVARLRAHERLDQKWQATIIRHLGRGAYRRWRARRHRDSTESACRRGSRGSIGGDLRCRESIQSREWQCRPPPCRPQDLGRVPRRSKTPPVSLKRCWSDS